ncbi:NAD+ synthase [Halosimplex amylolyticum]|uniref:NAD+ synthase n=1 Tax=Halosimplex amylolyticum TaxID=3396616 RepID=UPI003F56C069
MTATETIARADDPLDLTLSAEELDAHREHITDFIASQYEAAGADQAILGLSGGIDSTLTGYLLVEALGAENVHALVQPSEVNREENMSDAERVASELLDVEFDVVEINPLVDAFLDAYPDAAEDTTATGNLRARVRAVLNYLVANHEDGLVVGTGNRSEALVGYFTKYGDGAVDCHPIANLYKQQVRQLARHVGVPDDLAGKESSAELWEGQTDEGELGMGYDTLDSILALHVDGPLSTAATAKEIGVETETIETVRELYEASEHKRRAPPGPDRLH